MEGREGVEGIGLGGLEGVEGTGMEGRGLQGRRVWRALGRGRIGGTRGGPGEGRGVEGCQVYCGWAEIVVVGVGVAGGRLPFWWERLLWLRWVDVDGQETALEELLWLDSKLM